MKKAIIITVHLIFWTSIILFATMFAWAEQFNMGYRGEKLSFLKLVIKVLIEGKFYLLYSLFVFYSFYLLFLPKILKPKEYVYKIGALLFVLITPLYFYYDAGKSIAAFYIYSIVVYAYVLTFSMALFGSLSRFTFNWFEMRIMTEKLQKQNLHTELTMLKNQINPHFFFNTINNIDSLINSNTDKASEMLLKLSDIMRYMIYDTNVTTVQLSQDIKHIENFIDLQKIQFSNQNLVKFSVKGDSSNISVAPMLFIPFVENAFKHCTNKSMKNAIIIDFSIENNAITFTCENIFDKTVKINKDVASGVGLSNIKRRLALIYPNQNTVDIEEKNNKFKVKLTIKTNGN